MKKTCFFVILLMLSLAFASNAQLTPQEAINQLGRGINIGNTLDPPAGEGKWNNGPMQEYYFDDIKAAGFSTVRIPVTWCQHVASNTPYTVDEAWMSRVEQIVDWGLARGLNIILNAHHEDSIKSYSTKATVVARFDSTWTQIARRFQSKSDKLFFEILNEPHADNATQPVTQSVINGINTRILAIIRKTNPTRITIFSGIEWSNSDQLVATAVPNVNDKYLMAYYHSYDPWDFAGLGKGTYGSVSDINATDAKFKQIATWSASKKIPVIMDEFGAVVKGDYNSRMAYLAIVTEKGLNYNVGLCYWDDGGDFGIYNRTARTWSETKEVLVYTSNESPTSLKLSIAGTAVQLDWVNRTTANDSIVIERKKGNSSFAPIDTLVSTAVQYLDPTAENGFPYYYRVRTTINKTTILYSYPQVISIVSTVRSPYLGAAITIPGVIEAENFDFGGEGMAYHDIDITNQGNGYRLAEGVDIEALTAGGFQVGYLEPNEWLEYSISVDNTDNYKIECEVASTTAGGTFYFTFKKEGTAVAPITSSDVTVPATGGWQTMGKVSTTVSLPAGKYIMRTNVKSIPSFNLNKYTFTKLNTSFIFNETKNYCGFSITPNPAKSTIVISDIIDTPNVDGRIEIYDIQGMLRMQYLRSRAEKDVRLDVSNLNSGIYIVRIGSSNSKIIIE